MKYLKQFTRFLAIFVFAVLVANLLIGGSFAQDDGGEETPAVELEVTPVAEADETALDETEPVEESESVAEISNLDTVWMLVAGFLVFFMQAGFALVEAGFVRAKNIVNIFMKNFFDLAIGALAFWAVGFGIMFGASSGGFFGTDWFFLNGLPDVYPGLAVPGYAFFFFQFAFAATAATIASGAMAGRTEFKGYMVYSLLVTAVIYPIVGHWIWGGGWLSGLGFWDFAGSTVVHSTGGWVALTGAIILGARRNRFGANGAAIPGHSMTLAGLGTFILWLGWFGFNPGSQLNADGASIALISVTTNLAAAAGALTAMFLGWYFVGKPQLPWGLNGALAGLVAITAPCAWVTPAEAVLIGAIGGSIMYFAVGIIENFQIDDVVGAVSVHGIAGVWGTLSVGLFAVINPETAGILKGGGADLLISQVIGIVAVAVFVLVTSGVMFYILNMFGILRASEEGEILGLDIYEHGMVAYPEFTNSPGEPTPYNGS